MTPRQRQGRRSAAVRIAGGVERDREQRRVRERARRDVEEVAGRKRPRKNLVAEVQRFENAVAAFRISFQDFAT